jgi:hypothetical protein
MRAGGYLTAGSIGSNSTGMAGFIAVDWFDLDLKKVQTIVDYSVRFNSNTLRTAPWRDLCVRGPAALSD